LKINEFWNCKLKNFFEEVFLDALAILIFHLWEPIISSFEFFERFEINFF